MGTEPERPVELGKDPVAPRVQDAPEQPVVQDAPAVSTAPMPAQSWYGIADPADEVAPPPPAQPWAGVANPGPVVDLPPYPPPPPGPMYPAPGFPGAGYPAAGNPPPGYPVPVRTPYGAVQYPAGAVQYPAPPGYGYQDNTPLWSIFSFCCAAASVFGGLALCGLPVLITAPTGIVLGLVGHAKGEEMGKWAAIVNGAIAALAAVLVIVFVALLGSV
ncbi:hypothetical protein [Nocardia sp. NPDC058480]|uniref:hypothetical protein n=1 Tax=unclassified Nocardia TaxID=2637762 RepID=UPI00364FEC1A